MQFQQFQNKHKGQRCFILGCAPSLKKENLQLLKDEIVLICNKGFLAVNQLNLPKYDYFFCADGLVYKELHKNFKQELDKISVPRFYASKVAEVSKIDIKEDYVCYKRGYADSIAVQNAGFPTNFEDGWGATRGTVFDASIIAYWMGFNEIYLLGVDYDYSDKNNTHFYESGEREKLLVAENKITDPNKKAFQRVIKTVAVIKNHLNKNGVVYKNLSKGFLHKNMMDTDTLENIIK